MDPFVIALVAALFGFGGIAAGAVIAAASSRSLAMRNTLMMCWCSISLSDNAWSDFNASVWNSSGR